MVTVSWTGVFKSDGYKPLTVHMTFTGVDLNDVHQQIKDYVEDIESDPKNDWMLSCNNISNIRKGG